MPTKSVPVRGQRVVRHRLPDGTTKEYRYDKYDPRQSARNTRRTGDRTLGDLVAAYERSPDWRALKIGSQKNKLHALRVMSGLMGWPVRDIDKSILFEQRDAIAEASGDGAALNFCKVMLTLFNFALERGWLDANPALKINKGLKYGELPVWTAEQYEQAITFPEMPERIRRAFVLARWTAQRAGDLVAMAWSDVWTDQQGEQWIKVTQQKTGKKLEIPVARALAAELQMWRAQAKVVDQKGNPTGPLLLTDAGQPWRPTNLAVQVSNYLDKIDGFPSHLSIHGLRKFALTDLANRGATVHFLQAFGGHDTLQMVQHYTKGADQVRNAQAVRRLLDA